ncbi:hypothetical protein EV421DRAFT_1926370 [Armillaria borealis]|uniref:Uncharacterized protein n=1 Tax=Armillaria borealis TaxID=47425 RepID=A0AA39JRQ5_9AGAR|nr:hypothetical protein EV421DRAFT_1926370 [Armillaria borealis]
MVKDNANERSQRGERNFAGTVAGSARPTEPATKDHSTHPSTPEIFFRLTVPQMCSNLQQRREDAANGSCHASDHNLQWIRCYALVFSTKQYCCCVARNLNTFKQFFLASLGRTLDEDMCQKIRLYVPRGLSRPRSITNSNSNTSDIDDSKVDPLHSLYMICGEIGAEEMMERFGRLVWVRQLDRQARLFMFGERLCDYNIPFVNEQDTGTHDIVIDT